jgi:hypothetical protein
MTLSDNTRQGAALLTSCGAVFFAFALLLTAFLVAVNSDARAGGPVASPGPVSSATCAEC